MLEELEQDDAQTEVIEEVIEPVELTAEEIADLQRAADVSSQNFERAKKAEKEKKELQDRLAQMEALQTEYVDPDDAVMQKLHELDSKLSSIELDKKLSTLETTYPVLKDKQSEFEAFREDPENAGMKLETAAKAFLVENDLVEGAPKRKGLEKAGGGQRVPPSNGKHSAEDVKRLRETNYKEYMKLIKSGTLQLSK